VEDFVSLVLILIFALFLMIMIVAAWVIVWLAIPLRIRQHWPAIAIRWTTLFLALAGVWYGRQVGLTS
jgi:hypothetical protein